MTDSERIESLERQVAYLVGATRRSPLRGVFPAKRSADDDTLWQEQTFDTGEFVDFDAGRKCDVADNPAAIDPDLDLSEIDWLYELADLDDDGNKTTRYVPISSRPFFYAQVTNAVQDGTNYRWTYTFEEMEKTSTGYDGWTTKSGGKTGEMLNLAEEFNGESGLMGNGVDTANLDGTGLEVKPAPSGKGVHLVYTVRIPDEDPEYWFEHVNAIDGPCDPPDEEGGG